MDVSLLVEQAPLFAALPPSELQYLVEVLRPLDLEAGDVFLHEGEPGDRFFVVIAGEAEVIKALGTAEERLLNLLQPGDFVGEISLLDSQGLRTASARARTAVRLLGMTRADFDALLQRRPILAYEMVRVLSLRLRVTDDNTIQDLREKNRELAEAYAELQAAQAQIIEKERLERELEVAREIQESILPRELPQLEEFALGKQMVPARAVGGDLFDFIPLGRKRLGIVVGDVSDKGVPAAIFMALTRSLLRAEAHRSDAPAEVLRRVNRHLLEMNDAGMFVTVIYGMLDCRTRRFSYARAGHEVPLFFDAAGVPVPLAHDVGQPLALFPSLEIDVQTVEVPPGSTLLLYTDGATDAANDEGARFGPERLQKLVQAKRQASAQRLCDEVWAAIAAYQGAAHQVDDVTLVAIQAL